MRRLSVTIDNLRRGIQRNVGYGEQRAGAEVSPFTDIKNFEYHTGALKAAWDWSFVHKPYDETTTYVPIDGDVVQAMNSTASTSLGITSAQRPLYIFTGTADTFGEAKSIVVVTDAGVYVNGVCKNPTTDGTAGTVNVAASGLITVATGVDFEDQGVKPGDLIKFQGETSWRNLSSVTSATTAYSSRTATATGITYTVRKMFRRYVRAPEEFPRYDSTPVGYAFPRTRVFATLSNDTLWVAGLVGSGMSDTTANRNAVLRFDSIFATGGALGIEVMSCHLWSDYWATGDKGLLMDGSNHGLVTSIRGIVAPGDGRVCILTTDYEGSINRFRYSAHVGTIDGLFDSDEIWTETPGGYIDIPFFFGAGTALAMLGDRVVAFFPDGIAVGTPTTLQDPPYLFEPVPAAVGTVAPRSVVETPNGLVYLGSDNVIRLFNGATSVPLSDSSLREWISGIDLTSAIF